MFFYIFCDRFNCLVAGGTRHLRLDTLGTEIMATGCLDRGAEGLITEGTDQLLRECVLKTILFPFLEKENLERNREGGCEGCHG